MVWLGCAQSPYRGIVCTRVCWCSYFTGSSSWCIEGPLSDLAVVYVWTRQDNKLLTRLQAIMWHIPTSQTFCRVVFNLLFKYRHISSRTSITCDIPIEQSAIPLSYIFLTITYISTLLYHHIIISSYSIYKVLQRHSHVIASHSQATSPSFGRVRLLLSRHLSSAQPSPPANASTTTTTANNIPPFFPQPSIHHESH